MMNEHPARVIVNVRPNRLLSMAPGMLATAPEIGVGKCKESLVGEADRVLK